MAFKVEVETEQGNLNMYDKKPKKIRKKGFSLPGPEMVVIEAGGVAYEINRGDFSRLVRPFLYTSSDVEYDLD